MSDIIKSSDSKYTEYENLLVERDGLLKEANQIWITYLQNFGELITDIYEEQIECVKCKKTIAYYQQAFNHGGKVDPDALQKYLEESMQEYYDNLNRMLKENAEAKACDSSNFYEAKRSKELYRRLAKLIHPDINPETDRSEVLQDLWTRVLSAYGMNSVKELAELEVLVRKALKELGIEDVKADIPDIDERILDLQQEIELITHSEPYIYKKFIEDEDAVAKKKAELQAEYDDYKKYRKELEETILKMLSSGGLHIHVD